MKDELLQLILDKIQTKADLDAFFSDLLTPKEYRDLVLRYQLCKELSAGKTVREISENLKIAPARVVRGNRLLKYDSKILTRLLA
jgi:Trp operon repressor